MGCRTHGIPKLRCSARGKSTGRRCARSAIVGTVCCDIHGGKAPQTIAAVSVRLSLARAERGESMADQADPRDRGTSG